MEIIEKNKFIDLFAKQKLVLSAINSNNQVAEISKNIVYFIDLEPPNQGNKNIDKGYLIDFEEDTEREVETVDNVLHFLEERDFFTDDKIKITAFENFSTYGEFLEDLEFNNISMQELLEKYREADVFSLTTPYCEYSFFSKKNSLGRTKLDEATAKKAIKKLESAQLNLLEKTYSRIKESDDKIDSFDELIKNINLEISIYREKKKNTLKKHGGNSFICDQFSQGKTFYKKPPQLWIFYHALESIKSFEWITEELKKNTKERPLDEELNDKKYKVLKNNLIETEVTFVWHCTISSQLSKVFYFKLNDDTKNWLLQFKNDYDIDFDDLAFYKGKEVLFSSCKHEGQHNDLTKNGG